MSPTTPNNQPGAAGQPVAPQPPVAAGTPPMAPRPVAPAAPVAPAPQPIAQPAPQPVAPAPAPVPQPVAQPAAQPVMQAAPAPQPIAQPAPQPAAAPQPIVSQPAEGVSVLDAQPAAPAQAVTPMPSVGPAPKKRGRGKIIGIIIAAVAAIAVVAVLLFIIFGKVLGDVDIYKTDAFFIPSSSDSDAKYALFKKDGEKLTDFIFTQVSGFINGYSYVQNADGKEGIIDHDGKMTVEFGEYDDITPRVGIYEVTKNNKESLILGNGDVLASDYLTYSYSKSAPYVAVRYDNNQYELFNALGKKIADFESVDLPEMTDDGPETASAVSYKGGLIIISNKNYKPIKTIETNTIYDIDDASEDGKIITFYEHGKRYSDEARRAFYNKEFVEIGEKCDELDIHDGFTNKDRAYLTCDVDKDTKLIRGTTITDFTVTSYGDGYIIYDEDHFVQYNSEDGKSTIYVNGEKKATLDTDYRISVSTNGYVVTSSKAKSVSLYDLEGNMAYALKDTTTSSELTGVDKNGNIVVRNGKEDSEKRYYIVDKDGNEISGRYYSIAPHGDYYSAYRKDSEKADLLDKNGHTIISGEYEEFNYYDDDQIVLGRKSSDDYKDRKYDLIDTKNKTIKATIDGSVNYYKSGYFRVTKDNRVSYLTLEGKMIYSYESE